MKKQKKDSADMKLAGMAIPCPICYGHDDEKLCACRVCRDTEIHRTLWGAFEGLRVMAVRREIEDRRAERKDSLWAIVKDLAAWSPWDSCWVCRGNNPKKYPYTKCGDGCLGHRARALVRAERKRKEGGKP